jgi:hypothetical protein
MEEFLGHLIHFAIWVFFVIFAFAIVGIVATIRWIGNLVTRTENAAERVIHHKP